MPSAQPLPPLLALIFLLSSWFFSFFTSYNHLTVCPPPPLWTLKSSAVSQTITSSSHEIMCFFNARRYMIQLASCKAIVEKYLILQPFGSLIVKRNRLFNWHENKGETHCVQQVSISSAHDDLVSKEVRRNRSKSLWAETLESSIITARNRYPVRLSEIHPWAPRDH